MSGKRYSEGFKIEAVAAGHRSCRQMTRARTRAHEGIISAADSINTLVWVHRPVPAQLALHQLGVITGCLGLYRLFLHL